MSQLKEAYKKAPTYILEENITLQEYRNKYNADYKTAWPASLNEIGYCLTDSVKKTRTWWVGKDFFDKNYEIT